MSAISNISNSSYYQLSDPSAGPGGSAQTDQTNSLLQALSTQNTDAASSSSDAYLLDLSPEAQQYLNGSSTSSSTTPLNATSQNFTLSEQQQQTIAQIIEKYKDAPYTQATFDQIQNDLQAAGLDPTTLSRLDQAQSFNPTQLFVDYLSGNYSDAASMMNPDESTKSSNYMQQIEGEWQQISGNDGSTPPDTTTTSGA